MTANAFFEGRLCDLDPDVHRLAAAEEQRQMRKLVMIASESLCPAPVREALATGFVNLYAEGYPSSRMSDRERERIGDTARGLAWFRRYGDRRYYKGTEFCDLVEALAQIRVAEIFANERVPASKIRANVQPLSGAAANNAVYEAFTKPGDTVMGMALPTGGHLTHGSPFNRSGRTYRIVPYSVNSRSHRLDYDQILDLARKERPRMIIAGTSAYPWVIDWKTFREIADAVGAVLFADIAHPAGLVAGGVYPSPVGFADVITFTTHKTLCGPRGAVILTTDPEKSKAVDFAVFPGEQGGPHLHAIAAKAVCFRLAATPAFRALQKRVVENARALAQGFEKRGVALAYGGTDTHLLLVDCRKVKAAGGGTLYADVASRVLDLAGITINKNTIVGDEKALQPSGLRFGTTIVSQRGMGPEEMDRIAEIVTRLLTTLKPFDVQGQATALGRAKIDARAFREARAAVAELDAKAASVAVERVAGYPYFVAAPEREAVPPGPLAEAHRKAGASLGTKAGRPAVLHFGDPAAEARAAAQGAVLADGGDQGHFLVRGERAPALLQSALAADAVGLREGSGVFTLLLDEEGKALDRVALLRLRNGSFDEPRYILRASAPAALEAAEWLRALSDGFVEIGAGDLFAKVEGPAAIEEALWTSLVLAGPSAAACLKKAGVPEAGAGSAGPGEAVALRLADDSFEVLVPVAGAAGAWKALKEAGAKPAGAQTRDALVEKGKAWGVLEGAARAAFGEAAAKAPKGAVFAGKTFHVGIAKSGGEPKGEPLPAFAWKAEELPLRRTPLFEEHLKLTKKRNLVPFAGWEMPVVYTSIGDEHRTVRERAGLFDVAHMGAFDVMGPNAARFLDLVTTNYVPRLTVGESHYSYLLDPEGKCIDDLMIYRIEPQRYLLVVNAANAEKDWAWLNAYNEGRAMLDRDRPWARVEIPARIRNLKDPSSGADRRVDLALQGPRSIDTLLALMRNPADAAGLKVLARNHNLRADLGGIDVIVSRTGYTGEDYGYELYVHPDESVRLWNLILEKGRAFGVQATGLGARDSTRTEAGLPLYGHDLEGPFGIDPIEAGYGYFVKFHKPFFTGRAPLLARMLKRDRAVVRFRARGVGARVANLRDPVVNHNGKAIGHVTSSALVGEEQVGLAVVEKAAAVENAPLAIYCIPRSGGTPDEGNKKELKPGDKVLLPTEAHVVSRFPRRS